MDEHSSLLIKNLLFKNKVTNEIVYFNTVEVFNMLLDGYHPNRPGNKFTDTWERIEETETIKVLYGCL
jgi:hypothetical protein